MYASKRRPPKRHIFAIAAAIALFGLFVTVLAGLVATRISPQQLWAESGQRSPHELIRYVKRRLEGHTKLEMLLLPPLDLAQRHYERPTGGQVLPSLGKGQQIAAALVYRPAADVIAHSPETFQAALMAAKPGDIIELAAGAYRFNQKIRIGGAGLPNAPITVRGSDPSKDQTVIEFNATEGFLVNQPYWSFADLTVRGVCKSDDDCEHAFHIVGKAEYTTLRNNHIEDFNAHIKVNGFNGDWPDHGLLSTTTLTNTHPRNTTRSVTPFDLVGANWWRVTDNLVTNFGKSAGNGVAFGMFMKGASEGGHFERNLVICSPTDISGPGVRVGISFGGGGTDPRLCRDGNCSKFEHHGGLAANNIVAHCNDTGLDINNSSAITLAHNTLINTSGINLRRGPADAHLYGNLYEGDVRARDGAVLHLEMNQPMNAIQVFDNADLLQLHWLLAPDNIPSLRGVNIDFCGQKRADGTPPGALTQLTGVCGPTL